MEIVFQPVIEAYKLLVEPLLEPLLEPPGCLIHYKKIIDSLKSVVNKLKRERGEVEKLVEEAKRKDEVVNHEVEGWLASVQGTLEDVKQLDDQVNGNVRWFDLISRYKLSKEAKNKIDQVNELLGEREWNHHTVSHRRPNPSVESLPDGDFSSFESTEIAMGQVMDALKDAHINIIGVYGMGGVGKTTMVKQVAKKVKSQELFEQVVMVYLPQNPSLKKIQSDIAENLDMQLEDGSEDMRARKLSERLKRAESSVIILDNLWERWELADVGIPYGERYGCKIIFTTRSIEICNAMKSQEAIEVRILSEEDSWSLFKENAGDVVDTYALHNLARDVAKQCEGLPLAIVTLGRALRDKKEIVWKQALLELQRSNPANIMGMNGKVFASLEMSYNYLESEEAKSCFLLCCLSPKSKFFHRSVLAMYGMGERLFHDVNTFEEASDRVQILIDKLKASCLLLENESNHDYVKLHDVIHDVAISIASGPGHAFFTKAGVGLTEWPEIKNIEQCKRISLSCNNIEALPDYVCCPKLLTLVLYSNCSLKRIPEEFFEGMEALRVLDLSNTNISSLPLSLKCLENLRTLLLGRCTELRDVALIGRLKKLELLSLRESGIDILPEEIGELTNLKMLNLTQTKLEIVPPNVLSRLICLEELHMGYTFSQWEPEGAQDARQASIAEIESLTRLSVLHVHVGNINCMLQGDISSSWKNIRNFQICIGGDYRFGEAQRFIKLEEMSIPFPNSVKLLCARTAELHLVSCRGLTNIANTQEIRSENLELLTIKKCGEMEHVVSVEEEAPLLEFNNLKRLVLDHLENLKKICNGPLGARCLKNLKVLKVSNCNSLINILPSHLVHVLRNLEKLVIEDCQELLEVVNSEGLEEEHALLTTLKELELRNLPKVSSVWKGAIPIGSLHNLEMLTVTNCNLKYLFSSTLAQRAAQLINITIVDCTKMEKLIMEEICPSQLLLPSRCFQNLRTLFLSRCHGLQSLFSSTLARDLRCLMRLSVVDCGGIEVIITKDERVDVDMDVLHQLTSLVLLKLPKLTSFYEEECIFNFYSLKMITLSGCPELKWLPLGPQSAPNLEKMASRDRREIEALELNDESLKLRLQNLFVDVSGKEGTKRWLDSVYI